MKSIRKNNNSLEKTSNINRSSEKKNNSLKKELDISKL